MDGVRRFTGLVLGPCLTLVAVDGCAGGARRDCGLCEAQPQLNLAVSPPRWSPRITGSRAARPQMLGGGLTLRSS